MRPTTVGLALAGVAAAREPSNPFTDDFGRIVREALDEWHVAGVSIAVVDGDEVFAEGYGFATLPDVAATPETLWYVGSTTKAHVAAALAQLIDSGRHTDMLPRGWRTPVAAVIRDDFVLQDAWATDHVTLEDAASHQTGLTAHDESLRYNRSGEGSGESGEARRRRIVRDTVRNLRHLPMQLEPRVEFHYNNQMYTVLGRVVEVVTGQWLGRVLRERVWAPLGMTASGGCGRCRRCRRTR
ncbi:hypothetical protein CDD83_3845 [Cordyceps sp. RAO-2017]|nr:hypothetical protein CDD83_3845 [Cordyceps sp. RAO-2017]